MAAKKAQTFSTDALIGVSLFFMAALALFYFAGPATENTRATKLQAEAEKLPSGLSSDQNLTSAFIKGSKIDDERLAEAAGMSYENLKALLGVESDFCIFFEDEKGNIVPIGDKAGIGSPTANFSGRACNESITAG